MAFSLASRSFVVAVAWGLGGLVGDFEGEDVEDTTGSSSRIRCDEA